MKYLKAEKQSNQYYFLVHIDVTALTEDKLPDPAYVREFTWCLNPPDNQTEAQYLANIKHEIGLLVEDELYRMNSKQTMNPVNLDGF